MKPLSIETKPRQRVKLLPKFYKRKFREHVDSKLSIVIVVLCMIFVVFPVMFGFVISSMNDDLNSNRRFRSHQVIHSQNTNDWNLDVRFPLVECDTTVNVGNGVLRIQLNRDWAPGKIVPHTRLTYSLTHSLTLTHNILTVGVTYSLTHSLTLTHNILTVGVNRFIELIKDGFYNDIPFFRGVENFLVQFGATSHVGLEKKWNEVIMDDPQLNPKIPFTDGIVSYAGYGKNSRTNHVFFSLGNNPGLGNKPWEVPIGQVTKDTLDVAHSVYTGYGDDVMKALGPFKQGIQINLSDTEKEERIRIFFREKYPNLDWIKSCAVIPGGVESLGFGV